MGRPLSIERFADTHVRISLDVLKSREREVALLHQCIESARPFVVDNTNATVEDRRKYLAPIRRAGFTAVAYLFEATTRQAIGRNRGRPREEQIPIPAILRTYRRMQKPTVEEGFARVCVVRIDRAGGFVVEEPAG